MLHYAIYFSHAMMLYCRYAIAAIFRRHSALPPLIITIDLRDVAFTPPWRC